jgi:hypothetical protein
LILDDLVGKTVERVSGEPWFPNDPHYTGYYRNPGVYIRFTDDTTYFFSSDGYETDGIIISEADGTEWD